MSVNQWDWIKLLDIAQLFYNLQWSLLSNKKPFEIIIRQQSSTPYTLVIDYTRSNPSSYHFTKK